MARIEKTVFISYRRTDVYTALAVYENLKNQGYDVFFDYRSISSGDFEQIITSNIRARAHFLIILTPTALDRCSEPGDWLRREIEIAIDEKRNIVPLFFKGFWFGVPSVAEKLTGKLKNLSRYNGLNVHEDYFDEAMQRLRTQFLSKPLDTVLHPVSTEVLKAVKAEQVAADRALEQIEDVRELAKQSEEKPVQPKPAPLPDPKEIELEGLEKQAIRHELAGDFWDALQVYYKIRKLDPLFPGVDAKIRQLEKETQPKPVPAPRLQTSPVRTATRNVPALFRPVAIGIAALLVIVLCVWGGIGIWNNLSTASPEATRTSQPALTQTPPPVQTTPSPTQTLVPPPPTLGIGSTMTGEDGMTLLYVPAGDFTMGSDADAALAECQKFRSDCQRDWFTDEEPPHTVNLDAFWIDQTEVTNKIYSLCVQAGACKEPTSKGSSTRSSYYGNADYDNYPVIYVDWNMAKTYCEWAGRRLPTEAEWEKAARWSPPLPVGEGGGEGEALTYPWDNDFDGTRVNFCDKNCSFSWADKNSDDGYTDTAPVGSYPGGASPYGALDMAGNVWEWVEDWYDAYPGNTTSNSSYGTTYRVLRGGSWFYLNLVVRSAYRGSYDPTITDDNYGFRCALSP
jgi:formylglycine-generating enzyme required for sulfatase activity